MRSRSREPSLRFSSTEPLEEVPQLEEDMDLMGRFGDWEFWADLMGILEEIGGEFCRVTLFFWGIPAVFDMPC